MFSAACLGSISAALSCPVGVPPQGTKKLVSDSRGLVDFAVVQVDFTLNNNLPEGQVKVLGEIFLRKFGQAEKLNFSVPCSPRREEADMSRDGSSL